MRLSKVHTLAIRVVFDKPCTRRHAATAAHDTISGTYYPTQWNEKDPGTVTIRRISATYNKIGAKR